jgi:hypothetical protein
MPADGIGLSARATSITQRKLLHANGFDSIARSRGR